MSGLGMGEAAARITLDISDLASKHQPIDHAELARVKQSLHELGWSSPATHTLQAPRPIAVILAEIRRATIPALRPEDC